MSVTVYTFMKGTESYWRYFGNENVVLNLEKIAIAWRYLLCFKMVIYISQRKCVTQIIKSQSKCYRPKQESIYISIVYLFIYRVYLFILAKMLN